MASALLRNGPGQLAVVLNGLEEWLVARDYESVAQARGSLSQSSIADPSAFERSNYMKTLASYVPSWK
jgi:dihydroorotate dehydrogenase (fumarate)